MAIFKKKETSDSNDGTIDSVEEMVQYEEKKLWEQNPMEALNHNNVEKRKKMNWYARFVLSLIIVTTFIFLVWLGSCGSQRGSTLSARVPKITLEYPQQSWTLLSPMPDFPRLRNNNSRRRFESS